jgi:hypothetical protein
MLVCRQSKRGSAIEHATAAGSSRFFSQRRRASCAITGGDRPATMCTGGGNHTAVLLRFQMTLNILQLSSLHRIAGIVNSGGQRFHFLVDGDWSGATERLQRSLGQCLSRQITASANFLCCQAIGSVARQGLVRILQTGDRILSGWQRAGYLVECSASSGALIDLLLGKRRRRQSVVCQLV